MPFLITLWNTSRSTHCVVCCKKLSARHLSQSQGYFTVSHFTVMKYHDQRHLGKRGFIRLMLLYILFIPNEVRTETRGKDLEAGAGTEAVEEYCFLSCSSCFVLPAFLQKPQLPPRVSSNHVGWTLPCQTFIKKMPYSLAYSPNFLCRHFLN